MDDSTIQDLTRQLDSAIPREGAIVRVEPGTWTPDDAPGEFRIVANRAGYLRLGVACLQAAFAPYSAKDRSVSDAIQIDTRTLFGETPDDPTVRLERTEDVRTQRDDQESVPSDWRAELFQLVGLLVVGLIIYSFVVGAMTVIGQVLSAFGALVS